MHEKKLACEKYVSYASWSAAVNGINPIPSVDVAVDISIILGVFKQIRNDYGLSDNALSLLEESAIPAISQLANFVVKFAAQEGILMLLKNYAIGETTKTITKYIPFVGQAIAASVGYAITSNAGSAYLDKCHELAEEILKNNLKV